MDETYLSTDPNAGLEDQNEYLSTDPNAGLEPTEPSGFQKGLGVAQETLGVGQKVLMGAMMGGGTLLHKLAFPEEAKLIESPLVPESVIKPVVHALQTPQRTLLETAFGETGKRFSEASGQFISDQLAGFTSPESLALLAVPGAIGKMPKIREIAFGKPPPVPEAMPQTPEPPISEVVQPLTPETAPKVEEVIPSASEITSPESVTVPEVRTDVVEEAPLRQQGETTPAREEVPVQREEVVPESITAAAIRYKGGEIKTGTTHAEISGGDAVPRGAEDGFVTNTGRFVDAKEAHQIAITSKQLPSTQKGPVLAEDFPRDAEGNIEQPSAPVPQPEQPTLNPEFSDIHDAARKAAKKDYQFSTIRTEPTVGPGATGSEIRKQWDLAYKAEELNQLQRQQQEAYRSASPLLSGGKEPTAVAPPTIEERLKTAVESGKFSKGVPEEFFKRYSEFDSLPESKQKPYMSEYDPAAAYAGRMSGVTGDGLSILRAQAEGIAESKQKTTPVSEVAETTTAQPLPKTGEAPPVETPPTPAEAPITPQKPSKIGQSIEAKAVEAKLTEGFSETAGYDPISIADQAERATSFVRDFPVEARAAIRGEGPLPEGLRGTPLITAMEERLLKKPDAQLAYELANSPLVSETSAAAQELRMARERIPDSITAKFQEIRDARKAGSQLRGETTETVAKEIGAEIVKNSSKRPTWEAFVREITC